LGQAAKRMNSKRTNDRPAKRGVATTVVGLLVPGVLLVLPVIALLQRGVDFRWAGIYVLVLNALTYCAYASDKRRAEAGGWRVAEAWLHLLELLGGWPGAWLAQRRLRHKGSKGSYQMAFWLVVFGYQFAAFDSLNNWQLSRAALGQIERMSGRRK